MAIIDLSNLREHGINNKEIDIKSMVNMPVKEYEGLSKEEKTVTNLVLRNYGLFLTDGYKPSITLTQKGMSKIGPHLRKGIELDCYNVIGASNIPNDGCIMLFNHSNSHDGFVSAEFLRKNGHQSTFLAGSEGLSFLETALFKTAHSTMIDRMNKESCSYGLVEFSGKVARGDTGIIFGEGTWNLHPHKLMLPIKIGAVKAAAISGKPIIPTIMEYVEVPICVRTEKELYTECIIACGNPVYVSLDDSYIDKTNEIQTQMEELRKAVRTLAKIDDNDFDPEVYINHTWLKKFGTNVFKYDSNREIAFVRGIDGVLGENEYYYNHNGVLVPGVIPEDHYVKRKSRFGGITIIGKSE